MKIFKKISPLPQGGVGVGKAANSSASKNPPPNPSLREGRVESLFLPKGGEKIFDCFQFRVSPAEKRRRMRRADGSLLASRLLLTRKFFVLSLFIIAIVTFTTNAHADANASFGVSGSGGNILRFFGIGGMSCYSQPETDCDDDPDNGLFNSIGCRVMKSFNTSITPLYCNIIANPEYLLAVNAALMLYIIMTGIGFLSGIVETSTGEMIGRVLKATIVYAFAVNADIYFSIVYNAVLSTPDTLVRLILQATPPAGGTELGANGAQGSPQNFFEYVDQGIFKMFTQVVQPAINQASGKSYQSSQLQIIVMAFALWQIGGDMVGGMFMSVFFGFMLAYFSIMIRFLLAQLTLMFLLLLGPFFIPLFLFRNLQDLAIEWIRMMIAFITQIVLVVGFVVMVQHYFVEFYDLVKNGLDKPPLQTSMINSVNQYGGNTFKMDSHEGVTDDEAARGFSDYFGGDWKEKLPPLTVQLAIILVICYLASRFIKLIPSLANMIAASPSAPLILGNPASLGKGAKVHLHGQKNEPKKKQSVLNPNRGSPRQPMVTPKPSPPGGAPGIGGRSSPGSGGSIPSSVPDPTPPPATPAPTSPPVNTPAPITTPTGGGGTGPGQ